MGAFILLLGAAFAQLIYVARREREEAGRDPGPPAPGGPPGT
jgi:hypothetical protein